MLTAPDEQDNVSRYEAHFPENIIYKGVEAQKHTHQGTLQDKHHTVHQSEIMVCFIPAGQHNKRYGKAGQKHEQNIDPVEVQLQVDTPLLYPGNVDIKILACAAQIDRKYDQGKHQFNERDNQGRVSCHATAKKKKQGTRNNGQKNQVKQ